MLSVYQSHHSLVGKVALLLFSCGFSLTLQAQTAEEAAARLPATLSPDDAAIQKLLLRGYEAYSKKDGPTLLSLFSQQSPYLNGFKLFLEQDFAANERATIAGIRANLTRNVQIEGDKATARLAVEIHAIDKETGKEAEGFGAMDHTIRFVKENGVWKIWQFTSTAEELAGELLAAKTDEERDVVLKTRGEP